MLNAKEKLELECLRWKKSLKTRWLTQEEYDRLRELSQKAFEGNKNPYKEKPLN